MKLFLPPTALLRTVSDWPVSSLHRSRRNALVASTALVERRAELREVEEFLAGHLAARSAVTSSEPRRAG